LADIDLYLGVIPLAAFAILLVRAFSSTTQSAELRRHVLLSASLGLGLLATVAALSASQYGLGRTHERNLFFVVPLVLIGFLAWLEAAFPRPRVAAAVIAVVLVLLPLTIPLPAVGTSSGEDGLALVIWQDRGTPPRHAVAEMVLVAAVAAAVFLFSRQPKLMLGICGVALGVALFAGERHVLRAVKAERPMWRDTDWIDRAVGPDARVVAIWATTKSEGQFERISGLWADEFFNRSVRDVASADGPLPDGLPVEEMAIRPNGCLEAAFPWTPQYAVLETTRPLAAPVVSISPSGRATLYRLPGVSSQGCFARLQR
jgi:hypothetical protein